jgi:hypothetical protein
MSFNDPVLPVCMKQTHTRVIRYLYRGRIEPAYRLHPVLREGVT